MVYEESISISAEEIDRINRLLAIDSLEDMTDGELLEQGANTNVCEGVFTAKFANGASLNFDLCSGTHNYYDNVIWTSADGKRDITLYCEYELGDIEVKIGEDTYIVKVVRE